MEWNYRIIEENIEGRLAYYIAEVYYENGKAVAWSEPVSGYYDSRLEVVKDLKLMLKDSAKPTLKLADYGIDSESS